MDRGKQHCCMPTSSVSSAEFEVGKVNSVKWNRKHKLFVFIIIMFPLHDVQDQKQQ